MTIQPALETPERTALRSFLTGQRDSVLAIVDGLSDRDWHTSVVQSGWTPSTLIAHLTDAERHWFERVVNGSPAPPAPTDNVVGSYREQIVRSDQILAGVELDDVPRGEVQPEMSDTIDTVRDVVLHMIEETARHAGHLDIAREQLDGKTGLGPR